VQRRAVKTGLAADWQRFKDLRRSVKQLIMQKRTVYARRIDESLAENPKHFWSFVKSKTRVNAMPNSLRDRNDFVTDYTAKADSLNKFFHSVFTSAETDVWDSFSNDNSVLRSHNILSNVEITVSEVISELKNINPTKSSGPDNIPEYF
jgi:hypothetical protein